MALNERQALFVDAYAKTFNRTKAAIAAGYSVKTAYSTGARLLKDVEVAKAVSEKLSETAMTPDEVLMRIARIARGDMGDMLKTSGENVVIDLAAALDEEDKKTGLIKRITQKKTTRTIGECVVEDVVTTLELHDPLTALQLIGKNHRLFVDKTELTGADDGPIEYKDADEATRRIVSRLDSLAARLGTPRGDQRGSTDSQG